MREKVVPALQRALASERSNDIVSGALVALAKIGDVLGEDGHSPLESLIAARLSDPSQEIAETAAVSLGILSSDSCVPLLAALARDDEGGRKLCGAHEVSTRTRAFAAYGLGLVGARTASNQVRREIVDTLVQLVGNSKESNRELATAALIGIGLTPLEVAPDGGVLEARAAASSSRQAEIGWLRAIFSDATRATWLRAHAPWAMARLLCRERQRPAALAAALEETERSLLAALAEHTREREDVLQGCVLALGQLGDLDGEGLDAEIRSVLEREAEKGQLTLRTFALIALGQSSSHPGEGAAAAKSLGQVRGFLVGRLERAPSGVRPWAALGIALLERGIADLGSSALPPDADTCGALREALRGTTAPETAGAFAVALGIARDSEAVPLLREKLAAIGDDNARGYLALALGMVGAADAREPIQALVKSSRYKPELLRQAAIALGLLGDKSLVPELVQMLREAQSLSSQAAVASALGFIGDARSIDPLVALLEKRDATDRARGFAAVALGIVGDKEPFPWNAKVSTDCNYRAAPPALTSNDGAGLLDIL